MKSIRQGFAVAAVALLAASAGEAQTTDYYNICDVSDGYKICASSQVTWNGSSLVMKVWNMEGMGSTSLFGMAHSMTAIGLSGPPAPSQPANGNNKKGGKKPPPPPPLFTGFQVLFNGLDVSTYWSQGANSIQLTLGGNTSGHWGAINGCTNLGPNQAHLQTCGNYPATPYLEFTFSGFSSNFVYSQYNTFEYHSQQTGNNAGSMKVQGGPNTPPPPPTVTPEPVTMILLASGLFGIGGAKLRSRRRRNLIETEQA
jgi:hypothetical protein